MAFPKELTLGGVGKLRGNLAAYTRPAVVVLCLALNVGLHQQLKRRFAKRNQGFGGSASVTNVAVDFKIGVQRVRLNLCKSGLGAAYWARVYHLECWQHGLESGILKTHVRSFPTLVRCGSRKLDQQCLFKVESKRSGACHPCFEPVCFPKLK
jgi:hypothetical protein